MSMQRAILGALAAALLLVSGCGSNSPSEPPVSVDGVKSGVISQADVDHWIAVEAGLLQPPGSTSPVEVPDSPSFVRCVADSQQRIAALPAAFKPRNAPSADALKKQCSNQYNQLKALAIQSLIESRWIEGEARDNGITVNAADVQRQLKHIEALSSIATANALRDYLQHNGISMTDYTYRARIFAMTDKLRARLVAGVGKVTSSAIATYYRSNRAKLDQPERRDLLVIEARSAAAALQAKAELHAGARFATVAAKYSIDQASKLRGGLLPRMANGEFHDPAVDQAVFSARKAALVGPVHGRVGFWIFEITKVTPATNPSLAQASAQIRRTLISQQQQQVITQFVSQLRAKWQHRTHCGAGYVVPDCAGAKS